MKQLANNQNHQSMSKAVEISEKKALEIWDLVYKVDTTFTDLCMDQKLYTLYVHRVFWDQTMVVKDWEEQKFYLLNWSIDSDHNITITPENKEDWTEVEETWQPVQRSLSPELKSLLGIEHRAIAINTEGIETRTLELSRKTETQISSAERRTFAGEVRASSDGKKMIVGYAAVFNTPTELLRGKLLEEIAPGAFDDVLDDDVRALFNHSPNMVLGRNKAGTLRLFVDEIGLRYEIDVPNTTVGTDLLESIDRGDVSQSSFGFIIEDQEFRVLEDGRKMRTIKKLAELLDVSPVTFPAYETTEATARSIEQANKEKTEEEEEEFNYRTPLWQKYRNLSRA